MKHYFTGFLCAIFALGLTAASTHLGELFVGDYHLIYLSLSSYLFYSIVIKLIHEKLFNERDVYIRYCTVIFGIWFISFLLAIILSEHFFSLIHILLSPFLALFIGFKSAQSNLLSNLLKGLIVIILVQIIVFVAIYK